MCICGWLKSFEKTIKQTLKNWLTDKLQLHFALETLPKFQSFTQCGFLVGSCINEEGYFLPSLESNLPTFRLNAPVITRVKVNHPDDDWNIQSKCQKGLLWDWRHTVWIKTIAPSHLKSIAHAAPSEGCNYSYIRRPSRELKYITYEAGFALHECKQWTIFPRKRL